MVEKEEVLSNFSGFISFRFRFAIFCYLDFDFKLWYLWFLLLFRKTLCSLYLHINLQAMVFMVFGAILWLGFSWEIVVTVGC